MPSISGIATTRVSNLLASQTLLNQLQVDQADLLKIQRTISTGLRIELPSEDAPAALQAISLQNLIARKGQIKTNLEVSQSYLSATDNGLGSAAGLLNDARGTILGVADNTSSDQQRSAAATQVGRSIQQLVDSANQQFRGRYLFAGSSSGQKPFEIVGDYVQFNGNEQQLDSFSDINSVFSSSIDGNQVFGALSAPVVGTADLNPILTRDTKLSDLQQGRGISRGSIQISDGTNFSVVDLSKAETVGDVIDAIERNPPSGRQVRVDFTSGGLNLKLDSAPGNLTLHEVGSGATGRDLGLLRATGIGNVPISGGDLNPKLALSTPVSDILGVRAAANVISNGGRNDLLVVANQRGAAKNGLTINFVDDGTVGAGAEQVAYNAAAKTVTVKIQSSGSTANQVRAALNNNAAFAADYHVQLDSHEANNDGGGAIELAATAVSSGGAGVEFDKNSGLQVVNGGQTYNIDLTHANTLEDVLNAINGSGASLLAEVNATGNGINIRSRLSGADFSIGENGGQTATQLGIRTFTGSTRLEDLNHGLGVHSADGADFVIQRKDGVKLNIDLGTAKTVDDVLALINSRVDNQDPTTKATAQLAKNGNGIELVTATSAGGGPLVVSKLANSQAAEDLGLVPVGATSSASAVSASGVDRLTGRDVNPHELTGVFSALVNAKKSLESNDLVQVSRSISLLDAGTDALNAARAEVGARQQTLDSVQGRLQTETTDLTDQLSQQIGTDLPSAITELTARQAAYQASLQLTARLQQLTLLTYL